MEVKTFDLSTKIGKSRFIEYFNSLQEKKIIVTIQAYKDTSKYRKLYFTNIVKNLTYYLGHNAHNYLKDKCNIFGDDLIRESISKKTTTMFTEVDWQNYIEFCLSTISVDLEIDTTKWLSQYETIKYENEQQN